MPGEEHGMGSYVVRSRSSGERRGAVGAARRLSTEEVDQCLVTTRFESRGGWRTEGYRSSMSRDAWGGLRERFGATSSPGGYPAK